MFRRTEKILLGAYTPAALCSPPFPRTPTFHLFVPVLVAGSPLQFSRSSSSAASWRKIVQETTLLHVVVINSHRHHRPCCSTAVFYYVLYRIIAYLVPPWASLRPLLCFSAFSFRLSSSTYFPLALSANTARVNSQEVILESYTVKIDETSFSVAFGCRRLFIFALVFQLSPHLNARLKFSSFDHIAIPTNNDSAPVTTRVIATRLEMKAASGSSKRNKFRAVEVHI